MAHIETQERRKKRYHYLAHTLRVGRRVHKLRVFLGVDLSGRSIQQLIRLKQGLLDAKISALKKATEETFKLSTDFSVHILPKGQLRALDALASRYAKKLAMTDKDILRNVRETFLIRYTYDTNASEGNTISLQETELILKKRIAPHSHELREIHEIENTVKAYGYLESFHGELSHELVLRIHELVTTDTLLSKDNEGRYRRKGQDVLMLGSRYFPPKGGRIVKQLMERLIEEYYSSKLHALERAILFHSGFIAIHPFIDGNGRVSRLLLNWMLLEQGYPPINLPSKEHIEYVELMELSRSGDHYPLAVHIARKIKESLDV